jgi:hypothetical protein
MNTLFYEVPNMDGFTPDPLSPMQQVMEIIELAHQCISLKKAYVNLDLFGGSEKVSVTLITDIDVIEYPAIQQHLISPKVNSWNEKNIRLEADMADQPALQAIIDRLNEVLA